MKERALLPPRTRKWRQGDWYLYFDPYNFVWARVNESGDFVLEQLSRYRTIAQVSEEVARRFEMSHEDACAAVAGFVRNLIDAGFLHEGEYEARPRIEFGKRSFAHAVYLHLTNECNLKCPYCYNKGDREIKLGLQKQGNFAPPLGTDEYKALIARLIELGVQELLFTGGEPLMRGDALELLAFARDCSSTVRLEVLTNAILIKESIAERLCDLVDGVTISLDGHERHLHEQFRGRNTFAPTIRGIRTLIEVRRSRNQKSPAVYIVPALTDRNIGFLKEIFEFSLDELGADGLAPILFQAGDHQELSLQQIPTLADWSHAQARTYEYLEARARRGVSDSRQTTMSVSARNHCGVGNGEISVDASGFVYPCQSLHFDEFCSGSVREKDIGDIYREAVVMRDVRSAAVDRISVCRHCDLKYLCHGGCRATAYNVYRNFEAHNEIYCKHLEKIAIDRMWAGSGLSAHSDENACG
jgi:radical SAM protein with 4Fe4S-binding SPASM domain